MVLGISFNSRMMGIAILDGIHLLDYAVHVEKGAWSEAKAERMLIAVVGYLLCHHITSIAIYIPDVHYTAPQTLELLEKIKSYCQKEDYHLSAYQAASLTALHETAKQKKKALMTSLSHRYPELRHLMRKELNNKVKYYYKLFEAVAVATLLANE